MRKASLVVSFHQNDRIFDIDDPVVNHDNITRQWYELREEFARRGYKLCTHDLHPPGESEVVIYHDLPIDPPSPEFKDRSILLTMEPPVVKARAWEPAVQSMFRKVLTWDDRLVDGERFFKLRYGFHFPQSIPKDASRRKKLCTAIIGRKRSKAIGELYSERLRAIYWFEQKHPEEFEFYGIGWEGKKGPLGLRILGALTGKWPLSSYRGKASTKLETYANYRFAICYENVRIPGYLTEKLFDCLFSGIVPVYLGAPNISELVPADCFIHKEDYPTYASLYDRLKSIDEVEYMGYLDRIEAYVRSDAARPFHATSFAKTVVDAALG